MLIPSVRRSLQSLFQSSRSRRSSHRRSRLSTTHPTALYRTEQLEDRVLLSADPGWVFQIGGTGFDRTADISVGPDDNIYVMGRFSDTVDFDTNAVHADNADILISSGGEDGFIAKYSSDQEFLWVLPFSGTDGQERIQGIDFDQDGNAYIIGQFDSTSADFGPFTMTNQDGQDTFAAKLDSDGNVLWARSWGGTAYTGSGGVAVNNAGNVFLGGQFSGIVDFDPGSETVELMTSVGGSIDGYLLQLNSDGEFLSVMSVGGSGRDVIGRIAIDDAGNVYTSGRFRGTAQFGLIELTSGFYGSNFLMKVDKDGTTPLWVRQADSTSNVDTAVVGFDGIGGVYFTGHFYDTISFGSETPSLTSVGKQDSYITKWDTDGELVWAGQIGGPEDIGIRGIGSDGQGNAYFTGFFGGTADFDLGPGTVRRTSLVGEDTFLLKLDTDGNFKWVKQIEHESVFATRIKVSIDDAGNVYLTGSFDSTARFPTGEFFTSAGSGDMFVLKLDGDITTSAYDSADVPIVIKDAKPKRASKTISTLSISDAFEILDLNVHLDISHIRDQDLDVYLTSPTGTRVELFSAVGNLLLKNYNFAGTILDDQASTPITDGEAPFAGRFRPEGLLSDFNGENTAGTWTLEVVDNTFRDEGTLNSWSIEVAHHIPTPVPLSVSIDDVTVDEGDAGTTTTAVFTVSLSEAAAEDVTVTFNTQDGTATAGSDYTAAGGSVVILAGSLNASTSVTVQGDGDKEPNETFQLILTTATTLSGAVLISDDTGIGTIKNDDGKGGKGGGKPKSSSTQLLSSSSSTDSGTSDSTSTDSTVFQPTDPTLLLADPGPTEEESDDESPIENDAEIIATTDQSDLDSLFGDLDGSLQEELLAV